MSRPIEPVTTPSVVADIAAGRPVDAVWVNELGGVTFAITGGSEYVKVTPPRWAGSLRAEVRRLGWAGTYVRVPRVLAAGDGWLHTAGLAGHSAVDPQWMRDPRTAARAIGAGLRQLHDTLPVDGDGRCCGHVDLGELGVADRWADLAVAEWSLRYNFGGDWRDEFFDAYGVAPDQDRMDHFMRLWEDGE